MGSQARFVAMVGSLLLASSMARGGPRPERGTFLVADDSLLDPNFRETVVLVLDHSAEGTVGVIINRPTPVGLVEVLEGTNVETEVPDTVSIGGPVTPEGLITILRSEDPPEDSQQIFGNVYLAQVSLAVLQVEKGSGQARFYLGHAGWGAGQLESEMALGAWHVVPANDRQIFDTDSALVWRQLRHREIAGSATPSHGAAEAVEEERLGRREQRLRLAARPV
jgi:putative transcriptional regulator